MYAYMPDKVTLLSGAAWMALAIRAMYEYGGLLLSFEVTIVALVVVVGEDGW